MLPRIIYLIFKSDAMMEFTLFLLTIIRLKFLNQICWVGMLLGEF